MAIRRSGLITVSALALLLSASGCSDLFGDGGVGEPAVTKISGKVTLSSIVDSVAAKPGVAAHLANNASARQIEVAKAKAMAAAKAKMNQARSKGQLANESSAPTNHSGPVLTPTLKVLQDIGLAMRSGELSFATVQLYDADHPENLDPIAQALTDATGAYTLDKTIDGQEIPTGHYTLFASKFDANTGELYVAVQTIIKKMAGDVTGNDLVAQDSDALPEVETVIGLSVNNDGTFGGADVSLPQNVDIPVTFNMSIARGTVQNIKVTDSAGTEVDGSWRVSPDLLSAYFNPTANLTQGSEYTVEFPGGSAASTLNNVYGKSLEETVTATFTASAVDTTAPNASPIIDFDKNAAPITLSIRFGVDEPIDTNTALVKVLQGSSLGDRPGIQYVGKNAEKSPSYPYIYQIVPTEALQLGSSYKLEITGGKDLAGLEMGKVEFSFTMESTSAGFNADDTADEITAKSGVKDVLGKWIYAMDDRNVTLLSSYMTGDFYWVNGEGDDENDINRDGRLSLVEFQGMLNQFFTMIERCDMSITGDVVSDIALADTDANGKPDKAVMSFELKFESTNTLIAECGQMASEGPGILTTELKKINGGWLMTRGADGETLPDSIAALKKIDLLKPANETKLPEPAAGETLAPVFTWTAPKNAADVSSYAVVVVDGRMRGHGWVGLVNGAGHVAGDEISLKFSANAGKFGDVLVLENAEAFGIWNRMEGLVTGGKYRWAVVAYGSKTADDFVVGGEGLAADVIASSDPFKLGVGGVFQELGVKVTDTNNVEFQFSPAFEGFDVGSAGQVKIKVKSPDISVTDLMVETYGFRPQHQQAVFTDNPDGTATKVAGVSIDLSKGHNWIRVCATDTMPAPGAGQPNCRLQKEFAVMTSGGLPPLISFTSIYAVDATGAETVVTPNSWGDVEALTAVKLKVSGNVDPAAIGAADPAMPFGVAYENWAEGGRDHGVVTLNETTGNFTAEVLVFKGWNGVEFHDFNWMNFNRIGVHTEAGSTYVPPIAITSVMNGATAATQLRMDTWEAVYDAGTATSVTVNGSIAGLLQNGRTVADFQADWGHNVGEFGEQWVSTSGGPITLNADGTFSISVNPLYDGMNSINLNIGQNGMCVGECAGAWYSVRISTSNPASVYTPDHVITSIDYGASTFTPNPPGQWFDVNVAGACSIVIHGKTKNNSQVEVWSNNWNLNYNEWHSSNDVPSVITIDPTMDGQGYYAYSATVNVYNGSNDIGANDGNWMWQGGMVNSTCADAPEVLVVTSIKNGTTVLDNQYGEVQAGSASSITVAGTAVKSSTVRVWVGGDYTGQELTTTADASGNFSLSIPLYNGWNYISFEDGKNWFNLNVFTTGGTP
ncbi:MAG: Ig-like domain-containing protein [Gammaproteobacteria bacterium]|nr:Ig-like domain-containing protein [Gammaproteobacteria bacterium]